MTLQRTAILCVLIISMLNSCRSSKEVVAIGGVSTLKTEQDFFAIFREQAFQFNTFSARVQFRIVMPSGNVASSRAQLKIQKNDRLQISVQPFLGIEALRAELTPDSIKIFNRLSNWYMIDAFDNIKGDTEIDFNYYNLQALITNQLFLPGEIDISDELFQFFRWEQTHTGYLLHTNDRTGIYYAFTADSNEKLCATDIKDVSTHFALNCIYNNFRPVDRQLFPMDIHINLNTENQSNHSLSLQFLRVEVDIPLEMNFPVSANSRRVSLQQILQSIEQL